MFANNLATLFGATTLDPLDPRDPKIAGMLGMGRESSAGVRVDEEKILGLAAYVRGCNILSNGVAKVTPSIHRRTTEGREKAIEHPSWTFVTRRANQLLSASLHRKVGTFHAIGWGNHISWINRNHRAEIEGFYPMNPACTGMMITRTGRKVHPDDPIEPTDQVLYWTDLGGKIKTMLPENVLHIRGLSGNGYWGYPTHEILREMFGSGLAVREFGARFFGNGATSSVVVMMPPGLKDTQQDDYVSRLKKNYSGLGRAHKMMVLENQSTVTQLTIPPEAAQLLGSQEFSNREIALAIGIQSHKVGDQSRKSYASLEQSNQEHLDDDIDPHLQVWEDELGEKCLTEREKRENTHYIEFNRKELVRTNLEAQTNRERFEREWGISTANDVKRRNNENPIGPVGDTYCVPQNMHVLNSDGLPIVMGSEPVTSGGDQAKAFNELAMNRAERFVDHALAVAKSKSKSGKDFVEFLGEVLHWRMDPECVAVLLYSAAEVISEELTKFTEPPYVANDLQANVEAACPSIRDAALQLVRDQLETKR